VSDDFNIPGGCLREPYAWQHRGGRPRRPVLTPTSPSYAIQHGTVHLTSDWALLVHSITVRTKTPDITYSKEVIRLQVPLQPPCYDFSPLA